MTASLLDIGSGVCPEIVHEPVDVAVVVKPYLITVFETREVAPRRTALGPLGGLDLTGYSVYRLTPHFVGDEGAPFLIQEIFGPAGAIDQVKFEIGGDKPFQVNGRLYAVH